MSWRTASVSACRSTRRSKRCREHRRRDLPVHGGGAVAELRGARREQVRAVGPQRRRGVRDVAARGHRRDHRRAPCPRRRASRPAPRRRCRGAAPPRRGRGTGRGRSCPRRGLLPTRLLSRSGSPSCTALSRRSSNGSMPSARRARPSPTRWRRSPARGRSRGTPPTARCSCRRPRRRRAWPEQRYTRDRLGARVEHHADRVVAVGAGVAQHVDLHRGEAAVGVAPSDTVTRIGCRSDARGNSSVRENS